MNTQIQTQGVLPKISLCMMIKNEEKLLPRCLNSVRNLFDEIIVVDTGSTDRSVEIARSFGAKVFHHPWENDFSKHRNQSVSYAAGDWIFILDADEILKPGDGLKIKEAVSQSDIDSVMVVVSNFFNQGTSQSSFNQIRLFKKQPTIFYSGIVHNQLTGYRATVAWPIQIYHYGYDLDPQSMQAKFLRTSSLLKKRIEQAPDNFRHYHDLAVSYSMNKMFQEAVSSGIKAIELAETTEKKGGVLILWTHFIVASSLLMQKDFEAAKTFARKALEKFPDHLDSYFVLVMAYHGLKEWRRVKEASDNYFKLLETVLRHPGRFGYIVNNTAGESWRVYVALGSYYLEQGDASRSHEAFDQARQEAPVAAECLKIIAETYKNLSLWEKAAQYYQQAVDERESFSEAWLGLALAQNRMGNKDAALRSYEKALELMPDSVEALVNLGTLYEACGKENPAQELYEKALSIEPGLVHMRLRLANFSVKRDDLEACVDHCTQILKTLDMPCNRTLESLSDLADLYLAIAHELGASGREDLSREAMEVAVRIRPELLRP